MAAQARGDHRRGVPRVTTTDGDHSAPVVIVRIVDGVVTTCGLAVGIVVSGDWVLTRTRSADINK